MILSHFSGYKEECVEANPELISKIRMSPYLKWWLFGVSRNVSSSTVNVQLLLFLCRIT